MSASGQVRSFLTVILGVFGWLLMLYSVYNLVMVWLAFNATGAASRAPAEGQREAPQLIAMVGLAFFTEMMAMKFIVFFFLSLASLWMSEMLKGMDDLQRFAFWRSRTP